MSWAPTGVALATLAESSPWEILIGVRSVVLVRLGSAVHALDGACPHEGGSLGEGTVVGTRIICPLHEAAFDVTTGRVLADPFGAEPPRGGVEPARRFATRLVDGMVEVDVPDAA
jgi:apoptosis-inducing factor 3